MSELDQVLFQGGQATPLMLGRWRAKSAAVALPAALQLTQSGVATDDFRRLWRQAFPSRTPLPHVPLHDEAGRATVSFFRVWR